MELLKPMLSTSRWGNDSRSEIINNDIKEEKLSFHWILFLCISETKILFNHSWEDFRSIVCWHYSDSETENQQKILHQYIKSLFLVYFQLQYDKDYFTWAPFRRDSKAPSPKDRKEISVQGYLTDLMPKK